MPEEKPHEATPGKIRKARQEGNVAKSNELTGPFAFGASVFTVLALTPFMVPIFRDWFAQAVTGQPLSFIPVVQVSVLCAIPMLVAGIIGALGGILQTGGFVPKPLKLNFKGLNPINGMKKMFGKEGAVNAVKAFLCFCFAANALRPIMADVFTLGLTNPSPVELASLTDSAIRRIVQTLCMIGIVFGIADFGLTKMRWKNNLKMTHEEVKRDYKESNGDPQVKGKRKQFHRQMMRGAPAKVKDATMVVTNPNHFAIAMEYRPPHVPVPRILCRAADEMAFEVRRLAEFHDVPIIENIELARTLFSRGRIGSAIPEDTYIAVAEIVAALSKVTVKK